MPNIGPYEIVAELGRGGMGVVYRALDPQIGRTVAIKVIRLDDAGMGAEERELLRQRLFREARSAGILSHPNIVTIYQVGEHEGLAYIAMEFVDGPNLGQLLASRAAPSRDLMLRVLHESASALDDAHQHGIIHRDIKPANIMLSPRGGAKICDFGVAKVFTSQTLTQAGTALGSPHYMSPEQVQGKPVDGRSDQFSLAVVAYQMLSGRRPFDAETLETLLYRILSEPPRPVHEWDPSLSPLVNAVLARALSKNREERWGSCLEFADQLRRACEASGASAPLPAGIAAAPPVLEPGPTVAAQAPATMAVTALAVPARTGFRWRKPVLAGVIVAVAAGVAAGAWFLLRSRPPERQASTGGPAPVMALQPGEKTAPEVAIRPSETSRKLGTPITGLDSSPGAPAPEPPAGAGSKPGPPPELAKPVVPSTPVVPAPDWPTYRGNPQRDGLAAVRGPQRPRILWSAELGGQLRASPVLGPGGMVYIGSTDRNFYAVRAGQVVWSRGVPAPIDSTASIEHSGRIRVRLQNGQYLLFSPEGDSAASPLSGALSTEESAESFDGRRYYVEGNRLRMVGDSAFDVDLGAPASTFPAIDRHGNIYVGTTAGELRCLDRRGQLRWSYRAALRVTASPAVKSDGDVLFGCGDRHLYCVRNGELRWKFPTRGPVYSAPVVDSAGTVYFGSNDGFVYGVSDLGEEVWRAELGNEIRSSPALDRQGRLYVAAINRRLYCLSDY